MGLAKEWVGDRHRLFGGERATAILASVGVFGWTFLALCCRILGNLVFVSVKRELHRLEDDGILIGHRRRGSGFGARRYTISPDFPARDELLALTQAYAKAFPSFRNRVLFEMDRCPNKTKAYFRNEGVWPEEIMRKYEKRTARERTRIARGN
jgi:hypothetical protein